MEDDRSPMIGLDRDFPMTRTQRRVLLLGIAVWVVVGFLLFGGFLTGVKPSFSTSGLTTIDGWSYHYEYSPIRAPTFTNTSSPWNVTFFNVTFELWLTNWYSMTGGVLNGVGTEPNGSAYAFALGLPLSNGTRITFFLSPDLAFGVGWNGGWLSEAFAQLYVRN